MVKLSYDNATWKDKNTVYKANYIFNYLAAWGLHKYFKRVKLLQNVTQLNFFTSTMICKPKRISEIVTKCYTAALLCKQNDIQT